MRSADTQPSDSPTRFTRATKVGMLLAAAVLVSAGLAVSLTPQATDPGATSALTSPGSQGATTTQTSGPPTPTESASVGPGEVPVPTPTAPLATPSGDAAVPPASGDPNEEVRQANVEQPVAPPVAISENVVVVEGVEVKIVEIEAVQGEARGIGEVAGPAVRFKVVITNRTDKPISTDQALVNVNAGPEKAPASPLSGPGATTLPATIDPATTASAVYVYSIPDEQRQNVQILFNFRVDVPIASFEGPVPKTGE